jgi:hypothetical protein
MPYEMMAIHDALLRYVAVHNAIFKFSWRKMLPVPGLFKPIAYGQHESELSSIAAILAENEHRLRERMEVPSIFFDYTSALLQAVEALQNICVKLYGESQGAVGSYRYGRYRGDVAKYHSLSKRYQTLGAQINQYH